MWHQNDCQIAMLKYEMTPLLLQHPPLTIQVTPTHINLSMELMDLLETQLQYKESEHPYMVTASWQK